MQQLMRKPAQGFFFAEPVEPLGPESPVHDAVLQIAHKHRRLIQQCRLLTNLFIGLPSRRFGFAAPHQVEQRNREDGTSQRHQDAWGGVRREGAAEPVRQDPGG